MGVSSFVAMRPDSLYFSFFFFFSPLLYFDIGHSIGEKQIPFPPARENAALPFAPSAGFAEQTDCSEVILPGSCWLV